MRIPVTALHEITSISAGKDQTLALLRSGQVLGWGGAGSGRVTSPYVDVCRSVVDKDEKPVYLSGPIRYSRISAGYGVSLGVSDRQKVAIWGFCQAPVGGKTRFSEEPTAIDGVHGATAVFAGQFLYAAIDQTGGVHTWGFSTDGALGREATQINAAPGVVSIPVIQDLAIGDNFILALSVEGTVYGWGSNGSGQLGAGHLTGLASPRPIACRSRIKAIAAGSTHALAVTTEGTVLGWGSNHFGQVVRGSGESLAERTFVQEPVPIRLREKVVAVAAGMHYSVALGSSGAVYTWGWNGFGQLGHGDLRSRGSPAPIPGLSRVRAISAGEMHVIALSGGELFGWGCNESGQLGKAAARQTSPTAFWAGT